MKSTECHISVEVPIPLERAWALLSNFAGWPEWNPFVTRVHGARAPSVGARVQLDVRWADGSGIKSSNEIVEVIDGGTRRGFRWAYRGPLQQLGLLDTNRLIAVEYVSPDSCRYLSDERFTGPLTPLLPIDRIRDGFDRMAAGFASACGAEAAGRASESTARETPRTGVEIEALPEPPMASGALPLLGHLREFQTDHRGLFERGYREHGPVFGVALGPWKCAVIVGPEANATFYGRTDHELRTEHVYGYLRKMFGRVGLTHTPEGYDAERHILLAPFRANLMDDKLRVVDEEVQAFIAGLGERGEFELVGTLQGLLQRISAHMLMGREFRDRVGPDFWSLYQDLAKGLDQSLPPWLPLPRFIRRDIAKARLHRKLGELIHERRRLVDSGGQRPTDMLQVLVEARLSDGTLLPVERVIDYVLALVFAGFETTTGHASWAIIHVLQHAAVRAELIRVVDEQLAGRPIDRARLNALEPLRHAIRETERLMPVADRHVRSLDVDLEIGGYRIPRSWIAMSAVAVTHRMPELFEHPSAYDPSRFARGEGREKFSVIGFGAGRHRCTGVTLAYNEMVILLARLLESFELELVSPQSPRVADTSGVLVPEPTRVRYRRR